MEGLLFETGKTDLSGAVRSFGRISDVHCAVHDEQCRAHGRAHYGFGGDRGRARFCGRVRVAVQPRRRAFSLGKKVLAGSALFYLLFIAVYYDLEVNLILSGLSTLEQELANGLTPGYLGMAAKVVLLVLAVGFAVTAPKKPGEPSELKEVLQEAAEAMSLDKETMEKEVEQAVSAFEENIGAEELDGGEKQ